MTSKATNDARVSESNRSDADILALGDQIEAKWIESDAINALHVQERAQVTPDKSVLDELCDRDDAIAWDVSELLDRLTNTTATTVEEIAVKRRIVEKLEFCEGIEDLIASVVRDVRDLRGRSKSASVAMLASCPEFCF